MRVMLLAVIAGCGFSPAASTPADGPAQHGADAPRLIDSPPVHADAPLMADAPVLPIDAPRPPVDAANPYCTAPDQSDMVLCLEFDEAGLTGSSVTAHDGSTGHHDATIANARATTRTTPTTSSNAQQVWQDDGTVADIQTADSTDFGVQQFTLMAWVAPVEPQVTGGYYGIIEKQDQWLLSVDSNNRVGCGVQGSSIVQAGGRMIPVDGTWSFVACTYDGTQLCTYVNPTGSSAGTCVTSDLASIGTGPSHGVVVGGQWFDSYGAVRDHLDGSIDSARIFARAMTAAELAAASAQ